LLVGQDNIGKHVSDVYAIRYINQHPKQATELNAKLRRDGFIVPEKNTNMAAPLLARNSAARCSPPRLGRGLRNDSRRRRGLTIAASSAFAHDIWQNVVRDGKGDEREHVLVARTTAVVFGVVAIFFSIGLRNANVAFLVGLAFAIAASANVPPLLFALSWKRFSRTDDDRHARGTGVVATLIAVGPAVMASIRRARRSRTSSRTRRSSAEQPGADLDTAGLPGRHHRNARRPRSRIRNRFRATASPGQHRPRRGNLIALALPRFRKCLRPADRIDGWTPSILRRF